jgi:hypothetical protein
MRGALQLTAQQELALGLTQAFRRLLVQEVFLALRERLRSSFVELVDVDLRWGIPAEEAEIGRDRSLNLNQLASTPPGVYSSQIGVRTTVYGLSWRLPLQSASRPTLARTKDPRRVRGHLSTAIPC